MVAPSHIWLSTRNVARITKNQDFKFDLVLNKQCLSVSYVPDIVSDAEDTRQGVVLYSWLWYPWESVIGTAQYMTPTARTQSQ